MRPFLDSSRQFGSGLSDLFDFVHPATTALWNLRWQVEGFVAAVPDATDEILSQRFAVGSGVRAGNLREVCVEHPWSRQLEQFAKVVLFNVIALYEGWTEETSAAMGNPAAGKMLQFPSRGFYGQTRSGIREGLDTLLTARSAAMTTCFYPVYKSSDKYSFANLDQLAAYYRYHKEVRNSLIHRGGRADQATVDAYSHAATLGARDIKVRRYVALEPAVLGEPTRMSIASVIQLADVINRMVLTLDAELTTSTASEDRLLRMWRSSPHTNRTLPADTQERLNKIQGMCSKLDLVRPTNTGVLDALLREQRIGL